MVKANFCHADYLKILHQHLEVVQHLNKTTLAFKQQINYFEIDSHFSRFHEKLKNYLAFRFRKLVLSTRSQPFEKQKPTCLTGKLATLPT